MENRLNMKSFLLACLAIATSATTIEAEQCPFCHNVDSPIVRIDASQLDGMGWA
jgi:hypothetical protein